MFVFIADFEVKQGQAGAYQQHFQQRQDSLLGKLDGFVQDSLSVKPENPNNFVVTSMFESEAAYQAYQQSEAMKTYIGQIMPLVERFEYANIYKVAEVQSILPSPAK
ncbi:MAG: antibiotic biosynthesis monooxygenase family protein [Chloroflexota bacterium]